MAEVIDSLNAGLTPAYLTQTRAAPRDVTFTPQQLAYLETVFPEALEVGLSDADLRLRLGQRMVIAHIRSKSPR